MTDYTGSKYDYLNSFMETIDVGQGAGGGSTGAKFSLGTGTTSALMYFQRQYDLTLNQYVYYKLPFITSSPNPAQTIPNHTNNFKSDSHEVLLKTTEVI
jgi:hypothetical protein